MKRNRLALGLIILSVVATVGCTRKAEDNVKISLSLGGNGAMTTSGVTHIVINVRGPEMPGDIVWNWDARQGGTVVAPPAYITLDVPKGVDRLFQILVVSESEEGAMTFLYGDAVKTLSSSLEDVTITVASIGNGSGVEAEVGGRYVNADGSYPSGSLDLIFQPPGVGRPAMKIFSTAMLAGWFQIFLIDGAPFSYRWAHDGSYLFSNVTFTDPEFSPVGDLDYKVHLIRPAGYAYFQRNGGTYVTEARASGRVILGYFGPGATNPSYRKPVCYTNAGTMQSMYTDVNHTTAMFYDPGVTNTAKTIRLNNLGGLPASSCTSGSAFVDWLKLDGIYAGNGKDRSFGFRGAFVSPPNGSTITSSYASGNMTLSWNLLPDVSSAIDGVAVYAHSNFTGSMEMGGDGVDCKKLETVGFVHQGDVISGSSITFPVASGDQSTTKAALCPFKNGYAGQARFMFTGARYENYSGGGGGGSPATQLTWSGPADINDGACVGFLVKGESSPGNSGYLSTSSSSSVAISADSGGFYSDSSCGSSTSNLSFSPNSTWQSVWFKRVGPVSVNFTATFGGLTSGSKAVTVNTAGANDHFALLAPNGTIPGGTFSINKGTCQNMSLQVHDSSARAVAVGSLITSISITPAPANSYLFTDGGCTSPLTTVSLGAGQTTLNFYVKIPFADANANISLTASDGTLGNGTITMTPTSPGAVQNLNFWMGSNEPVGNCNSGKVVSTDSMSNPSPVAANTTVNLSASNGTLFYSSGTCTGTTSTVTITGGQAEAIFYWRRYNAGADTVTATDATTSLTAANTGVNYTTGGATQIIFVLPGQNYNGGAATYAAAVTGTPNTFVYNTSSPPITAYLVDNYFNLITAASGSCSVINTSDTFDTNPSSVPFTSGAANFNLSAASSPGTSYTIQGAGSSCSYSVVDSAPYDRP